MKLLKFSFLAAALACGLANAQTAYTTPVGYVTVPINEGYNLVGVTVHQPLVTSGTITGVTSTTISDASADFTTLESNTAYILEINSGPGAGIIQEIINPPNATTINTSDDLTAFVVANESTYKLRKADTLNSIFGSSNEKMSLLESADGSSAGADTVLIPKGDGTFDTYFFVNAPGVFVGWFDGAEAAGDTVINYADGIFVRTLAGSTATDLVVSGEVKPGATSGVLISGYNLLSSVAPAALTLNTSGLQNFVTASADGSPAGADTILIPNSANPGTFNTYFYVDAPGVFTGWFDGANDSGNVSIQGGFFLRNFGATKEYMIDGPLE